MTLSVSFIEGSTILEMIDFGTRLMAATILLSKTTKAVTRALESRWCSFFGWPKKFRLDRGTENVADAFTKICDINNVLLEPSPAQGQSANGIVERHGAVLSGTIDKLRLQFPRESLSILLEKAVGAHNSLHTGAGGSPSFMAFGLNPKLPEVTSMSIAAASAMSQTPSWTPSFMKRLDIAHAARKHFLEANTCKKLIAAVAHPSRPDRVADEIQVGDIVYFWNVSVGEQHRGWRGPARVSAVDPDAKTVQCAYGRHYITRHQNKIIKVDLVTASQFLESPPPPPGESVTIQRVDDLPHSTQVGPISGPIHMDMSIDMRWIDPEC